MAAGASPGHVRIELDVAGGVAAGERQGEASVAGRRSEPKRGALARCEVAHLVPRAVERARSPAALIAAVLVVACGHRCLSLAPVPTPETAAANTRAPRLRLRYPRCDAPLRLVRHVPAMDCLAPVAAITPTARAPLA